MLTILWVVVWGRNSAAVRIMKNDWGDSGRKNNAAQLFETQSVKVSYHLDCDSLLSMTNEKEGQGAGYLQSIKPPYPKSKIMYEKPTNWFYRWYFHSGNIDKLQASRLNYEINREI